MKFFKLSLILLTVTLSACSSNEHKELKSPCVGAHGSPCDKRRPTHNVV